MAEDMKDVGGEFKLSPAQRKAHASNLKIKIKWLSYIGLDKIASAIQINASHVMRGVVVIC